MTTAMASTTTITKSARQPTESMRMPEIEGPTAGAKLMTRPTMPMAEPRRSRGKSRMMSVKTIGMTTPVPHACITRPSSSTGNAGAAAATREPRANIDSPPMNSLRVLNRPTRNAFRGMMTASTRAYPDVSH